LNNKTVTYLLLLLVAGIWGFIIYRVMISTDHSDTTSLLTTKSVITKEEENDLDTFSIRANYGDPFLGKKIPSSYQSGSFVSSDDNTIRKRKEKGVPKEAIDWSFISYQGLIKNRSANHIVALINIDGKEYMVKEGDIEKEVKILKNTRDSIRVEYKNKKKYILRKR
jgi:hypothetical protein